MAKTATVRGFTIGEGTRLVWTSEPLGLFGTPNLRNSDRAHPPPNGGIVVSDPPNPRNSDRPRSRRSGAIAGADLTDPRSLVFELAADCDSETEAEQLMADVEAAFDVADADEWLDVTLTGSTYSLLGRCRGTEFDADLLSQGSFRVRCRFDALDGIRYGPAQMVIATLTAGSGLILPVVLPVVIGTPGGASNIVDAYNSGTANVDWVATIPGPILNPRIEHIDTGRVVRANADVPAGQSIVFESETTSILLDGTVPRPQWESDTTIWFDLGRQSNALRFSADSPSGTATITWRSGS